MAIGHYKLRKQIKVSNRNVAQRDVEFPGVLGVKLGGKSLVKVPTRPGYVYVQLHNNLSELIQAYNDQVPDIYGLPVIVVRDYTNINKWKVKSRDYGRYDNWGNSAFIPSHGTTHSFDPYLPGADIVWVFNRQFMPLLVMPSGSASGAVLIREGIYRDASGVPAWFSSQSSDNLLTHAPTGTSNSRMVLLYIDGSGNLAYKDGSIFSSSTSGTAAYQYIPTATGSLVDLAAVQVSNGSTAFGWEAIYDVRKFFSNGGDGGGGTTNITNNYYTTDQNYYTSNYYIAGSGISVQQDDVTIDSQVSYLNFEGAVSVEANGGGKVTVFVSGSSSGGSIVITGSSAGVYSKWDVDAPPVSPSGYDDEFDDNSLDASWGTFDPDGIITVSEGNFGLAIDNNGNTSGTVAGIYKDVPSPLTDYTVYTRLDIDRGIAVLSGEEFRWGIAFWDNPLSTSADIITGVIRQKRDVSTASIIYYFDYLTEYSSGTAANQYEIGGAMTDHIYMKAEHNSGAGTVRFYTSYDGMDWLEMGAFFKDPSAMGLFCAQSAGDYPQFRYRFFRYVGSLPADTRVPGQEIEVGGGGSSATGTSGATSFLDLTDTPDSYVGQGSKLVGVNVGATALTFYDPVSNTVEVQKDGSIVKADAAIINFEGSVYVTDTGANEVKITVLSSSGTASSLTLQENDAEIATLVDTLNFEGNVGVTDNGLGKVTIFVSGSSGGGSSTFLGLTDTPNSYTGMEGRYVVVNGTGTALEFASPPEGGSSETEIRIPIDGFGKGAAKPNETVLGNWFGYAFSINDLGYFSFEVPEDWDEISNLTIALHYYIDEDFADNTGEVRFAVIETIVPENGTTAVDGTSTTINGADQNIPSFAKSLCEYDIVIPAAYLTKHKVIGFQLKRVALVGGNNPTAEPVVVGMEAEYDRLPLIGTLVPDVAFTDLTDVPNTYAGNEGYGVYVNSSGTALEFVAKTVHTAYLTVEGTLTAVSNPLRLYNATGKTRNFTKVFLSVSEPPSSTITVDLNKGGTTVFTNQANRPTIISGSYTGQTTTFDVPTWSNGEYITMDIDQVGSGTAGSNLVAHILFTS